MKSRFFILLFCCVFITPAGADLADARAALARGDAEAAAREYARLAESGDAVAQAHLGYMYYTGEGVGQDYGKAVEWYRKAADQGNADARYNLAVAYAFGEGVEQDYKQAAEWYRKAADQGHAVAQYSLGLSYTYGEGVEQDYDRALHWFETAAAQDYAAARDALDSLRQALDARAQAKTETARESTPATDSTATPDSAARASTLLDLDGIEPALPQSHQQPGDDLLAAVQAAPADTGKQSTTADDTGTDMENAGESMESTVTEEDEAAGAAITETTAETSSPADGDETTPETTGDEDRKESFLARLFGSGKDDAEADDGTAADTSTTTTAESALDQPVDVTDEPTDETPEAADTESGEKKDGFLRRLFGSRSGDNEDVREDVSAVDEPQEKDVDTGTSREPGRVDETTAEAATEKDKKGFFGRLFGTSPSSGSVDTAEGGSGEQARSYDPALYEQGIVALNNGDYSTAASAFREGGDQGDPRAQYRLGTLYYQGLGVTQSYSRARRWYELAAEAGNADAQYSLGNMYFMGEGVEQSDSRAEYWYEKAAGNGHASARHNLSSLKRIMKSADAPPQFIKGEKQATVQEKPGETSGKKRGFFKRLFSRDEESEETIDKASIAGERKTGDGTTAQANDGSRKQAADSVPDSVIEDYRKGMAYSFGDGVEKDPGEAYKYFKRAAEAGFAPAQYQLGVAHANGEGTEQNGQQAVYWYKQAAIQGHTEAQRNLGLMYMEGEGVEQDRIRALAWYSILAEAGNAMDLHRRDTLIRELSPKQIEESHYIKTALQSEIATAVQ